MQKSIVQIDNDQSDYELERGKPVPSKNHSYTQRKLIVQLSLKYEDQYEIMPELSILIKGKEKVPDIALYQNIEEYTPGRDEVKVPDIPDGVIEILSPK